MAKQKTVYNCTECGGQSPKWQGQCPHCGAWNTLVESVAQPAAKRYQGLAQTSQIQLLGEVTAAEEPRLATGIGELDRVLGGGLVKGGVVLLGGDPGIGKSTLLLQALSELSKSSKALYVSGEESGATGRAAGASPGPGLPTTRGAGRNPAGENPGDAYPESA